MEYFKVPDQIPDIRDPIAMWIVAKFYAAYCNADDNAIKENTLTKIFSEQGFVNVDGSKFKEIFEKLKADNLIRYVQADSPSQYVEKKKMSEHGYITEKPELTEAESKDVEGSFSGYILTFYGKLAFRRQIRQHVQGAMNNPDRFLKKYAEPAKLDQFKQIIDVLKSKKGVDDMATDLAINNPWLLREFLLWATLRFQHL